LHHGSSLITTWRVSKIPVKSIAAAVSDIVSIDIYLRIVFPGVLKLGGDVQPAASPEHVPFPEPHDTEQVPETAPSLAGVDDWEIDSTQLKFLQKVTTGSFGDL
jgi:hypothetical protein